MDTWRWKFWSNPSALTSIDFSNLKSIKDFERINSKYFAVCCVVGVYSFSKGEGKWAKLKVATNHVFQIAVTGIIWATTVKAIINARNSVDLKQESIFLLVSCMWFASTSISMTGFYLACHGVPWSKTVTSFHKFRELWNKILLPRILVTNMEDLMNCHQYMVLLFLVAWIAITASGFTIAGVSPDSLGIFGFTSQFATVCWAVNTGFFCIICLSIRKIFTAANCILENYFNAEKASECLACFADAHQHASKLCEIFSEAFGFQILVILLVTICELCTQFDGIIVNEFVPHKRLYAMYALSTSSTAISVWYSAASINSEAYRSYNLLNTIGCKHLAKLTLEQSNILAFQQFRLASNTVGIDIPMVGIVKSTTIATIFSVFCTYLFLLLQFHMADKYRTCAPLANINQTNT